MFSPGWPYVPAGGVKRVAGVKGEIDHKSALTFLRGLLMVRAHDDVDRKYGTDSMLGTSLCNFIRDNNA